jgi:hypothetical protein
VADYDEPRISLTPIFGIEFFTPQSRCPHRGSIRKGSRCCCMVCNKSGMDHKKQLKRDPRTDPKPEPEPTKVAETKPKAKQTRKERRRGMSPRVIADLTAKSSEGE